MPFNGKGVKVTRLELCTKKWVINKVCCEFQHWPLNKFDMDVNEFVKENGSKFLVSLDHEGVPMQFCKKEDWCVKMARETLKCAMIRDLKLVLLFKTQRDDAHTRVKKCVAEMEKMDKETPATLIAFAGICMTREENKECIMAEEYPEVEKFNPVTIELRD